MEKPSEPKPEDLAATSTSVAKGLHSKPSVQAYEEQSHKKLTDAQQKPSESVDIECSKCHSSDISKLYIPGQDVLHCICITCENEWVE